MKYVTAALCAILLAGCASAPPRQVANDDDDFVPMTRSASRGVSGGVFTGEAVSLTSDSRAYRVGDAVTVILQETTQASKRAGTSFSKSSSAGVSPIAALGKTFGKTAIDISADREFEGD